MYGAKIDDNKLLLCDTIHVCAMSLSLKTWLAKCIFNLLRHYSSKLVKSETCVKDLVEVRSKEDTRLSYNPITFTNLYNLICVNQH